MSSLPTQWVCGCRDYMNYSRVSGSASFPLDTPSYVGGSLWSCAHNERCMRSSLHRKLTCRWGMRGVGLGRTLTFTNGETRSPAATVPDKHTMSEPVISPGVTDGSAHLLPVSYYSVVRLLRDVWLTLLSLLLIRCLMDGWTENVAASVKGVQQLKVIGLRVILSDRSQILCLGTQALMLWIHHL